MTRGGSAKASGAPAASRPPSATAVTWLGAALLAAVVALAALLAIKHFGGRVPGCGPQSACADLEATAWGKVPGIGWPVSFAGLAYFAALLVGWIVAAGRLPMAGRWVVRAGCAASVLFLGVMVALGKVCPYCLGIHIGNLAFLVVLELGARRSGGRSMGGRRIRTVAGASALAFAAVTLALGVAQASRQREDRAQAETERRASAEKILAQASADPNRLVDLWGAAGFTGRHRLGPETSPIRIVTITDYQCPDCKRLEGEVEQVLAERSDVSLSVKHFPMCPEVSPGVPCNPRADRNLHPNSCWAARAAEAAGILRGDDGFWAMHRWLFRRGGSFTNPELKAGLAELGHDFAAFVAVMTGPETLRRVQADAEEAWALGLFHTPMVFVNGVEFKGWQVPGALARTVAEVAAKNPPARKATADRPVLDVQRCIDDWREQAERSLPADTRAWSQGASAGPGTIDVVLFGDYQEEFTAAMDIAIRALVADHPSVRYTFRHYPIDPACNPVLPANVRAEALHPLSCRAARAAEAAGTLGGAQAYWKMHAWLMGHHREFGDAALRSAAPSLGLEADALLSAMERPELGEAIAEDARAAKESGLASLPMVFVNSKWVPHPVRGQENIVLRILQELTDS